MSLFLLSSYSYWFRVKKWDSVQNIRKHYYQLLYNSLPCCLFHSCRAKPGGVHTPSGGSQKTGAVPEPEDLIAPGTPIQFDIMLPASEFQDQNRAGGRWVDNCSRKFAWVHVCERQAGKGTGGFDANFLKVPIIQFPGSFIPYNGSQQGLIVSFFTGVCVCSWKTHKSIWRNRRWLFSRKWR